MFGGAEMGKIKGAGEAAVFQGPHAIRKVFRSCRFYRRDIYIIYRAICAFLANLLFLRVGRIAYALQTQVPGEEKPQMLKEQIDMRQMRHRHRHAPPEYY